MKIYLASSNDHKKREMAELFPEHQIVTPKDEGIDFDPAEDGETFYENSLIKARALWEIVHCPVFADDSGLCADALNGAPGIYTSRYAGPQFMKGKPDGSRISQEQQNEYLVKQVSDAVKTNSTLTGKAHYVCAMVLYMGPDRLFVAQETMEGEIIPDIKMQKGSGGFGYDPIFFLPEKNCTAAELSPEQKNAVSHRGKAARAIKKIAAEALSQMQ